MGTSNTPAHLGHMSVLPDDLLRIILWKLCLSEKITAGLVCKHWDQVLKSGTAASRHWVLDYNIDIILSSTHFPSTLSGSMTEQLINDVGRYHTTSSV
jgi:hypothetical protein